MDDFALSLPNDDLMIESESLDLGDPEDPFAEKKQAGPFDNVKYAGNFEEDSKAEFSAIRSSFAERAREENKRRELATDSEYWICLCFQTREQKEAFLAGLKLSTDADKYIDGRLLAVKLGIDLPANPIFSEPRVDHSWDEFSLKL